MAFLFVNNLQKKVFKTQQKKPAADFYAAGYTI